MQPRKQWPAPTQLFTAYRLLHWLCQKWRQNCFVTLLLCNSVPVVLAKKNILYLSVSYKTQNESNGQHRNQHSLQASALTFCQKWRRKCQQPEMFPSHSDWLVFKFEDFYWLIFTVEYFDWSNYDYDFGERWLVSLNNEKFRQMRQVLFLTSTGKRQTTGLRFHPQPNKSWSRNRYW